MGAAALPALLVAGVTGATMFAANSMMKNSMKADTGSLQSIANDNTQNAIDTLPTVPEAPTNNVADAETNEAEAERQRQQQAMAASEAALTPNGGLGLTTPASTKKKTLGGLS